MAPRLTFYGAVQAVTGSCYLLEAGGARVLLECGLNQGPPEVERLNRGPFPFSVPDIDAVVLSHAHLDHSGLLPKLARYHYAGPVYCTPPTRELLKVMLMDAAYLEQRDTEWENRRKRRKGDDLIEPIYTLDHVRRILRQCRTVDYGRQVEVVPGVSLRYLDAGHILGSTSVCLDIRDGGRSRRLLFSGDIGNPESALMKDPEQPDRADVVLMEGTYGDREHKPMAATFEELAEVLAQAHADGGNVLIPAFAVGRTQEVIYHLLLLRKHGRLPQRQIFLDSPMAIEVSELYLNHLEALDQVDIDALTDGGEASLDHLLSLVRPTRTPEESMALNQIVSGAIIIAGSGMCTGGRIRHHLKHNLWRRETHVVIVGFQAQGTPGRMLVEGAERLGLFGEDIIVRARIHTLGGYSAHAGRSELLRWAGGIGGDPRFYLVHGEPKALEALREGLEQTHGIAVEIPSFGQSIAI